MALDTIAEGTAEVGTTEPVEETARPLGDKESAAKWRGYIAASEQRRKLLLQDWCPNVDYRVMRPFGGTLTDPDTVESDRVAVPEDWARTKQKQSQLSFQVPKIVAKARRPEFITSEKLVTAAINACLNTDCRASYVIDEVLADVINAAGLMVTVVGVDRRTEEREIEVPIPRQPILGLIPNPLPPQIEKQKVTRLVSQRYTLDRVSPSLFLWPREFTLSDWDKAPWLGYQTFMPIVQAKREFAALPRDFKSSGTRPDLLTRDIDNRKTNDNPEDYVKVSYIWYYASLYDADKTHPDCIRRIVFVEGHDDPVVHEETDWQVWVDETMDQPAGPASVDPATGQEVPGTPPVKGVPGHYLGLTKLPVRVGTLTYVSDLATPPSDTGAARAQVKELIKSRSQMLRNRDHSIPIRWFDVNRIDEMIIERMKQGTWQDLVPVNGPGDRAIGEVARAQFPRENFEFQRVITGDLDRAWALSSPQLGGMNATERSATEVATSAGATDVRLDYEKGRVGRYIVEIAEVLFSLMQRWQDFSTFVPMIGGDGKDTLAEVNKGTISGDYMFEFKADSSDRIDLSTRQNNALKMFNVMGQSPTVNRMALEEEIFTLHGMDFERFRVEPKAPGKEPINVSFRLSGAADLMNPIGLAVALQGGVELSPEHITAAKTIIADALAGPGLEMAANAEAMAAGPSAPQSPEQATAGAEIEPPPANEPILKRSESGERLLGS